eukprot:TRINITY_DN33584_c0_g1_i1.p1 TRINITY_DN33584_c0_g1~~TRINITY_DN33584_c0_g1_i1.p1  ORF type:complete len:256 (+),score=51.27 TRINITY_DN33584_c0_g1_i1:73-840(+)
MSAKSARLQVIRGLHGRELCKDLVRLVSEFFMCNATVRMKQAERIYRVAKCVVGSYLIKDLRVCVDMLEKGEAISQVQYGGKSASVEVLRKYYQIEPHKQTQLSEETHDKLLQSMKQWLMEWCHDEPTTGNCLLCATPVFTYEFCSGCQVFSTASSRILKVMEARKASEGRVPLASYFKKHSLRLVLTNTGEELCMLVKQVDHRTVDDALSSLIDSEEPRSPQRPAKRMRWDSTPRRDCSFTPRRSCTSTSCDES